MTLTFLGFHMPRDGYGYGTIKIAEQLQRLAPDTGIVDMRNREGAFGVSGDRAWRVAGTAVALCTPDWLPFIQSERLVAYTMFEATKLPRGWVEILNTYATAVVVPCEWNAEVFRANGVTRPICLARWGIDPRDYFPLARHRAVTEPYTFLWSGTPDRRKGWDVTYRAFRQTFGASNTVRLILHFRQKPAWLTGVDDANVEFVEGLLDVAQQRALLQRADAYVFPSRGEGWGSPPREAAATGLPVIATNFGGLAEEIARWALPLHVKGMSNADYGYWDDIGEWAEPDGDQLGELMRWCYENRHCARVAGLDAAAWLSASATWERTARALLEIVEEERC